MAELALGLEAARLEAVEKERMGDARQSYEPTAKVCVCLCLVYRGLGPAGPPPRYGRPAVPAPAVLACSPCPPATPLSLLPAAWPPAAAARGGRPCPALPSLQPSTERKRKSSATGATGSEGGGRGGNHLINHNRSSASVPLMQQQQQQRGGSGMAGLLGGTPDRSGGPPGLADREQRQLMGLMGGGLPSFVSQDLAAASGDLGGLSMLAQQLLGGSEPAAPAASRGRAARGAGLPPLAPPAGDSGQLQQNLLLQLLQQAQMADQPGAAGPGDVPPMRKSEPAPAASTEGVDFLLEVLR